MCDFAEKITEMTEAEFREYELPRVHSQNQINFNGPIPRNVRIAAGLVSFSDDIAREREEIKKNQKAFLHKR